MAAALLLCVAMRFTRRDFIKIGGVAGGAALAFDVRQPSSLARLLTAILDDPEGYSVWKERARTRARERYRWDDVARRYETLLEGDPGIP